MANEANTASGGEAGVHRLRDIVVEEVSLVDRAANKRRFLVVKRDSDAPPARGVGAGRGGFGKTPKAKPGQAGNARRRAAAASEHEEMDKAGRSKPPWAKDDVGDENVDAAKADDEEDEAEAEDEELDDGEEDEGAAANKANDEANEEDDEEEDDEANDTGGPAAGQRGRGKPAAKASDAVVMPAGAKTAVLRVLAQALERLMGVANRIKEADEPDDEADVNVPVDLEEQLEEIGELLEDAAERLPTAKAAGGKTGVVKAGRRMAKDRLDRFQKALTLLSDVLKELIGDARSPTSAPRPSSRLKKDDVAPGVGELLARVGELTQIVKRQQDQLAAVRKTRATSNAISVDGTGSPPSDEVSWPLDMNRPISRDTVSKSFSFYED